MNHTALPLYADLEVLRGRLRWLMPHDWWLVVFNTDGHDSGDEDRYSVESDLIRPYRT